MLREETGASIPPDDSSLPKTQAAGISHEGCMIVRSNDARYLATLVVIAFNMASRGNQLVLQVVVCGCFVRARYPGILSVEAKLLLHYFARFFALYL